MKKIIKYLGIDKRTIVGLIVAFLLVGALAVAVLLKNHISFTKIFFLSYSSFKYDAGGWLFPDELPSSVNDIIIVDHFRTECQ